MPGTDTTEGHRFNEQVDIDLIDRATAEGQFTDKPVDRLLIAAEDESGERVWRSGNSAERLIKRPISKDGQNGPKDLVLHDRVVPCDGINDRRIEIPCCGVGPATTHNLVWVEQAGESVNFACTDDAGIIR